MRIAISTGGGDAPGLNAVIRSAVLSAINRGWEVLGIKRGFAGLLGEDEVVIMTRDSVRGIAHLGGTILRTTNRGNPFSYPVTQPDGSTIDRRSIRLRHRVTEGIAAIGRAKDRPAEVRDAAHRIAGHDHHFVFTEEAREAAFDAEDFPAAIDGRQNRRANDGVQTRRIAAAGRDRDSHRRKRALMSKGRSSGARRSHPASRGDPALISERWARRPAKLRIVLRSTA